MKRLICLAFMALIFCSPILAAGHYDGFKVSIYITSGDVGKMTNTRWLDSVWTKITSDLKVDKVYIETHRDGRYTSEAALLAAKKYFTSKKVAFSGGITFTDKGDGGKWKTFCYTTPEGRAEVKKIAEFTAKHFDEIVLDDFFFNDCKCEHCTAAKGNKSWTDFRMELMNDAAANLVVGPAKAVNPACKVIVKYPNWYEHFPALGFDLKNGPNIFDGIWTGTESRSPDADQHLQRYLSYQIVRYFNNIAPGRNGGGWIDAGGMRYADIYAEQAWLTIFGKAPECALFEFSSVQRALPVSARAPWQGTGTSFDWDKMGKDNPTLGAVASQAFETVNRFYSKLGNPVGIKSYRPVNSVGDDNLQNFLGMAGLPIEMVPEFPTDVRVVLLTEQAAGDKAIVSKIKQQLKAGKEIILTSGLLKVIQKELGDIIELRTDDKKGFVSDFGRFGKSKEKMIIPQVLYFTNDAWEDIPAIDKGVQGWAFLMQGRYENGSIWVLTVPDSYADIYELPVGVLNRIRTVAGYDVNVRLEGPAKVSLFAYDNGAFIVESFLDEPVKVKVVVNDPVKELTDILSGVKLSSASAARTQIWLREVKPARSFEVELLPHSFRVFQY